jgi:hypothetical protein
LYDLKRSSDSIKPRVFEEDRMLHLSIDSIANEEAFIEHFFADVPAGKAMIALSGLQHDAREIAYYFVKYMNNHLGEMAISFSRINANVAISQNARQVKAGEPLTVKADVSDFPIRSQPEVFINNAAVATNKEGVATVEIKSSGEGGQAVPVTIYFKGADRKRDSIARTVLYNVEGSKLQ